jgi:hypothetical membrane protein
VIAAVAGIVGPVMFVTLAFVQSLLRPEHSLIADPISALAAGPNGWVQNVNFLQFGFLMILHALGLHYRLPAARRGVLGTGFLVLSGFGLMWAGLFPATSASGGFEDRALHVPGFIMTFSGAGTGLILMSRRMAADPRWRSLAAYTLATGVAVLVMLVAGAVLVRPPAAPLHSWWGLFQWVLLAVWLPCTVILALRALRNSRTTEVPH